MTGLDLLSCPFCGSDDIFLITLGSHAYVECQGCGAKSNGYTSHDCSGMAASAWNTRSPVNLSGYVLAYAGVPSCWRVQAEDMPASFVQAEQS